MSTQTDPRQRMTELVAAQSTSILIASWDEAARQFLAVDVKSGDHVAYLITMAAIEDEMTKRGVPQCTECGAPEGAKHMDGMGC